MRAIARQLARRVSAGLILLVAACAGGERDYYEMSPYDADPVNTRVALAAERSGSAARAIRAWQRLQGNTGHPMADLYLGRAYYDGRGVDRDLGRSAELFQAAYRKPWPRRGEAAYYLARQYDAGDGLPRDRVRALSLYREAYESGTMLAALPLAKAYDEGQGVPRDPARARELFEQARALGDPRADLRLAQFAQGDGAAADEVQELAKPGVTWLRGLAKDEDNSWAAMQLATIYEKGELAPVDPELAYRYLRDAAKYGSAVANVKMAERDEATGNPKRALSFWRRAAEGGHASGMVKVGFAALKDDRTAEGLDWLKKAAALGHPSAMVEIGRRELTGEGVALDQADALVQLEKAAAKGHPSAMYVLGRAYLDGNGLPRDPKKARTWLTQADTAGHPAAKRALAQL